MQLLKYIQSQGIGSRKQCQWLIENDCIAINGTIRNHPKDNITPDEVASLEIDGEPFIIVPMPYFYILLNKPAGYETSHKPQHYPSVFSLFPDHMRQLDMQAVGRLDADTTGVLLITNDGQFNHRMTSPKHKVPKLYQVTLKHPTDETLCKTLENGVLLHDENETVAATEAILENPTTLLMTITEGKYHQVKRMISAAGNRVEQLHRRKFGDWHTENLPSGTWKFIFL
ncbi:MULTISPECIES: 16S rRNA pseudouridine(516) synthase [unclassified Neisseria]|uniref:16S rRNA pseudouridine(516) synthase n=1 Tax=unclassified Neisseria TaxID=2623750 RepID=UPI00266640C3|nr:MULTISPECIES: pseudouridine synthase [unclassified Neisseria]MDO1508811.1 pseudouridine synthase [Neisseria sp. MVDL19-042950]MDO1515070.1 pseudouridine synthase [Neisseria sp. MVDL18-041461]MDO1562430.1 pseudouridine synthase [Neisseria sp. MVDL20-010259]